MASLRDSERQWIVRQLACYETPTDVAEDASERFGKDIVRQQVEHYDPHKSDKIADRWATLFKRTREEYLTNERRVAIANKLWRLRQLQSIVESDDATREEKMEALEQAAKEAGGKYTNEQRLQHSGPDGAPINVIFDADTPDPDGG